MNYFSLNRHKIYSRLREFRTQRSCLYLQPPLHVVLCNWSTQICEPAFNECNGNAGETRRITSVARNGSLFPFCVTPNHIFLVFFLFGYSVDGVPWAVERKEYGWCTAVQRTSDLRGREMGSFCKLQGPWNPPLDVQPASLFGSCDCFTNCPRWS